MQTIFHSKPASAVRSFRPTSKAFTLIELLVVIAIIAILAAILFPVFARARENARRSSCQSNLKQIAIGLMQYTQDYDERYPSGKIGGTGSNRGSGWAGPIIPYIKSGQVFTCPSDTRTPNANPQISYAYNGAFNLPLNGWNGPNISAFSATSRTVMLFEVTNTTWDPATDGGTSAYSPAGNGFFSGTGNLYTQGTLFVRYATGVMSSSGATATNLGWYNAPTGRHLDTSNFLYADGHAKALRGEQVSAGLAAPSPTSLPTGNVAPLYNAAGTEVPGYAATFSPI